MTRKLILMSTFTMGSSGEYKAEQNIEKKDTI